MENIASFKDIIDLWPSRKELAEDVGASLMAVHHWHGRDRIPAEYDAKLLDAACARNIPLHWRRLMDLRSGHAFHVGNANDDCKASVKKSQIGAS
ncbi:hypothetical protein [Phaeobacter sp. S60]|uniref:hypothetical protein n=1 Tax=Phaeobacter sp. S60 TaxID=1569353 RepID=UPI00058C8570|nr:hypothetical protein [Phaeobacter sp. S60]KII11384.1 hypothetical protein OO25_21300 [Phaeobacter sp. S60]